MSSNEVSFNSNLSSNNNNNINSNNYSKQHQSVLDKQKLMGKQLSIRAAQSHDRLPMVSTDNDSSGYPRSDNYPVTSIDHEVKRIEESQNVQDTNLQTQTKIATRDSSSNNGNLHHDEALVNSRTNCRHQTRFIIALLGLTIAVVNCYAQATFCISIVEMVLPSDYVFKGESGDNSVVKVVVAGSTGVAVSTQQNNNSDDQETIDHSCPVEYRYRDYYDSWRFSTPESSKNSTVQQQAISRASSSDSSIDTSNRFDWDASRQGLLLGAFAIGTAPLQILGGRLAEIHGAKWVLLAGCVGTALTNLTIPFLAHFSFTMLILNRITMGVAQAGMEPGLMCLLAEWLTPAETGFFISMLLFAICIGFFLGSLCSSFLLTLGYGWPITYYVAGGMNLVVAIIWFVYANSRPGESRLISAEELKYIETEQQFVKSMEEKDEKTNNNDLTTNQSNLMHPNISSKTKTKTKTSTTIIIGNPPETPSPNSNFSKQLNPTQKNIISTTATLNISNDNSTNKDKMTLAKGQAPWNNILRTPSVWAFIVCKISIRWCADVLAIELPTYLANVLHLSIKLNGILNSVSSALFAICSFITGYLVNELLKDTNQRSSGDIGYLGEVNNNKGSVVVSTSVVFGKRKQQGMSKTNLRKLMQSIASFGSAICVFLMTQYDCNIIFSMSMLLILSCCLVMGTGGELQIPYDMTSRYPGTLHGMACTLSVSGWLAPPLIGLILGDQPSSRYRWSLVWYLTALINLVGGLVFVLFADASPRDFDHQESERRRSEGESISRRKIKEDEKSRASKKFQDLRQFGVEDKTISIEQEVESDRGRHMMSYYNIACKSSDTSPPRKRPSELQRRRAAKEEEEEEEEQRQQQDLSWSSYFDRDLIKIRQIEDSFIKPGYLNNFDSIAQTQTMIFPYHTSQKQRQRQKQRQKQGQKLKLELKARKEEGDLEETQESGANCRIVNSENDNNNEYATNLVKLDKQQILSEGSLIWRLWSRVPKISSVVKRGRSRRKFCFEDETTSSKVGKIRTKRKEGDFQTCFESGSINSVILPDVLPHGRKRGIREEARTDALLSRGVESGPSTTAGEEKIAGAGAGEVRSEGDGNQQLARAASTAPALAWTPVSTIMAPLASKTITHL